MPDQTRRPLRRTMHGVLMTVRGATPAHADLRSRLIGVTVVTVVVDLLAAGGAWGLERHRGGIHTFGDALFWTTTQMLTVSSQLPNPITTGGKILDVGLELYAVTVVTTLAGTFASFFHHRSRERRSADAGAG